jgi:hypothetical protein
MLHNKQWSAAGNAVMPAHFLANSGGGHALEIIIHVHSK